MKNYRQNESNCLIRHHENGPFLQVSILLTSAAQLFSFLWDIWRCTCSSCTCTQGFTSSPGWQSHPQQSNSGNTVCPLPADLLKEDILTLNAIVVQPADLKVAEVYCKREFHHDGFSWKPFIQYLIFLSFSLLIWWFLLLLLFIFSLLPPRCSVAVPPHCSSLLSVCLHISALWSAPRIHTDGFSEYWPLLHNGLLSGSFLSDSWSISDLLWNYEWISPLRWSTHKSILAFSFCCHGAF